MTLRETLAKIYTRIRRCESILGILKRRAKELMEDLKIEMEHESTIRVQCVSAITDIGKSFTYLKIEVLTPTTLAEILASIPIPYGVPVVLPKIIRSSYIVEADSLSFEEKMMRVLSDAGCILSSEMILELELKRALEKTNLGLATSSTTVDGVVHRVGTVYLGDISSIQAYRGGPSRITPSLSQKIGEYTPTLLFSPYGPGTVVLMSLPVHAHTA